MNPHEYEQFITEIVEEGPEHGAVLITTNPETTDVYARTDPSRDARWVATWLLGAYIHHLVETAQQAGGSLTMEQAAADAIEAIRGQG